MCFLYPPSLCTSWTFGDRWDCTTQLSINAWRFSSVRWLHNSFTRTYRNGLISSPTLRCTGVCIVDSLVLAMSWWNALIFSCPEFWSNPAWLRGACRSRGPFTASFWGSLVVIPLQVTTFTLKFMSRSLALTLCKFCVGVGYFSCIFSIKIGQYSIAWSSCLQYLQDGLAGFGQSLAKCPTSPQL